MIKDIPFPFDDGLDLCLALTVEKEVAFTFDILKYEMLVLNLSDKYMPQIWIEIDHPKSTILVPNSFLIQNRGKSIKKGTAILLSLAPHERGVIRFGLCISEMLREDFISVRCRAAQKEFLVVSNKVYTKIIKTVGRPCLIKQSLLLPSQIPDSGIVRDIEVDYYHQKLMFLPFSKKGRKGELCCNTRLLISGVISYSVKVNYRIRNTCYERTIEYCSGHTESIILPEGAIILKPNVELILYSTDFICIGRKLYCCVFGMLFFQP
ncbi:hypothetical protein [Lachnoclostridium phytofermentans]|uniref:Uncharacterized protein n=1 Tax=Lachnoclostridium phytofermentans (strain ATCC 700394 / DSM 18823 / ISDg) TaxID=357809 RepID=A9KL23_LACP7|nr:hypothetical protein [Lachnoclostridium phytofermentans]ABX44172.1 hypothetical protein Cphy_3825 [Lachnoclostridium phytofermentans ISDg]